MGARLAGDAHVPRLHSCARTDKRTAQALASCGTCHNGAGPPGRAAVLRILPVGALTMEMASL